MSQKTPIGQYIREKRVEAEMSLRELAKELGVSHVYLGEVERGLKKTLPRHHWPKLAEVISSVTEEELEEKEAEGGPFLLELQGATPNQRALSLALARSIRKDALEEDDIEAIFRILRRTSKG